MHNNSVFHEFVPRQQKTTAVLLTEQNLEVIANEIGGYKSDKGAYQVNHWGRPGYFTLTPNKYLVHDPEGGYSLIGRDEFDLVWVQKTIRPRTHDDLVRGTNSQ